VFSCSEREQKQLNTWVSFGSAEQPLLDQFSVSGNIDGEPLIPKRLQLRGVGDVSGDIVKTKIGTEMVS
jgi:DNA helicase-2/ATP-dependent DNA helicase PcrA